MLCSASGCDVVLDVDRTSRLALVSLDRANHHNAVHARLQPGWRCGAIVPRPMGRSAVPGGGPVPLVAAACREALGKSEDFKAHLGADIEMGARGSTGRHGSIARRAGGKDKQSGCGQVERTPYCSHRSGKRHGSCHRRALRRRWCARRARHRNGVGVAMAASKVGGIENIGPYNIARAALPMLRAARQTTPVNIASTCAGMPMAGTTGYSARKARLLLSTPFDLGPTLRANAICPGVIQTEMTRYLWENPEHTARGAQAVGCDRGCRQRGTVFDDGRLSLHYGCDAACRRWLCLALSEGAHRIIMNGDG